MLKDKIGVNIDYSKIPKDEILNKSDMFILDPKKYKLTKDRILVKEFTLNNKLGSGMLEMGVDEYKQTQREMIKGKLISFTEASFKDWSNKPEIGDTVYFCQFSGNVLNDKYNNRYRNMSSKDVTGYEKV